MCGIAGVIERRLSSEQADNTLAIMLRRIAHRGPDGSGTFGARKGDYYVALGHRRLSIIDVEGGKQPMSLESGGHTITFNGEVYNFVELRRELEALGRHFETRSDTEVVLAALAEWGDAALGRFNGMFAFAAWDEAKGTLLVARDRAGIKPLFYAELPDGGLAFASELGALLDHPRVSRTLDAVGLRSYFFSDYAHPPHTMVRGVKKLAPGEYFVWRNGRIDGPHAYWRLRPGAAHLGSRSPDELARELWERLGRAVDRQLVADVPLGVFLSGGIDSSVVAALAAQSSRDRITTFSIGFEDARFDESEHARCVAKHLGTEHVEETLRESELLDVVDPALEKLDEPVADHSILPTYLLARLAARRVKVALGGDGGDELFAGYPTYKAHQLAGVFTRTPRAVREKWLRELVTRLPSGSGYQSLDWKLKRFFGRWDDDPVRRHLRWMSNTDLPDLEGLLGPSREEPAALSVKVDTRDDLLNGMLALDFTTYMPGSVLPKVDRASMAHGLEARPPMLDNEVIDWAFSLPSSLKLRLGTSKWLLKKAAEPHLPREIIQRPKRGFSIPLATWLRGPLAPKLERALADSPLWQPGWLRRGAFHGFAEAHRQKRGDHSKTLWALIVLDAWVRREGIDVG